MKKIISFILLLSFTVFTVKAQKPDDSNSGRTSPGNHNPGISQDPYFKEYLRINRRNREEKRLSKFYQRKLIVVLAEEDPIKLKYFRSSPDKLSLYKELIQVNNDLLRKLVPHYWKQLYSKGKNSDTIQYKKYSEVLELCKNNPEEYFTMEFSSLRENSNEQLFELAGKSKEYRKELLPRVGEYGRMEIKLLEEFQKPALHQFFTITSFPNELDFAIAIQQLGNFFLERYKFLNRQDVFEEEIKARRETLKSKIILVDTFQVERRNKTFAYIGEKFTSPYGFTDEKGLLEMIRTKDTLYVYVVVVPFFPVLGDNSFEYTSGGKQEGEEDTAYFHLLIDAETSEILEFIKNESRVINKRSWARYADSFELDNSTLK